MKKILSFLLMTITIISMCSTSIFAEGNFIRARDLNNSALTEYIDGVKVTTLSKSKSLKNAGLQLSNDEMLIVGKNVTLNLYKGADINGTVYVENGGKLLLSGGEITVSGSGTIFSDGMLSINKASKFKVGDGGTLFVGKTGTLRTTTEKSLYFDEFSNIVCIGKTNSKNICIARKVTEVYIYESGELHTAESPSELLPNGIDEYCTSLATNGKLDQKLIFIFDSGACIKAKKINHRFLSIGGCKVAIVGTNQKSINSDIGYSRIYEIDGCDYIYDMNGVTEFSFDEKGKAIGYEMSGNNAVTKMLECFSEKNYIGKFPNSSAKIYRIFEDSILVIWKDSDKTYSAARLIKI